MDERKNVRPILCIPLPSMAAWAQAIPAANLDAAQPCLIFKDLKLG